MRRILLLAATVALAISVGFPTVASADTHSVPGCVDPTTGAPVPNCSFTQVLKDQSFSFPSTNPCSGAPGVLTFNLTNVMFHITVNGALDAWITTTITGALSFVPTDPTQPSLLGHVESWFGASFNRSNMVVHDIFNATATGTDGSTITAHAVEHASVSATGVTNSFSLASMTCG
jgi:hypothetical protein